MAEWQEQLNTILSDPEAMSQIAALAQSLSGQPGGTDPPSGGAPPPPEHTGAADADPVAPPSSVGGLDPELLRRLAPLMQEMNRRESSETAAFLQALRPFLSEPRRAKVERAAQLARLIHLGKTFLTAQGQGEFGRV